MRVLQIAHNHPKFSPGGTELVALGLHRIALEQGHESYFLGAVEPQTRTFNPGTHIMGLDAVGRESVIGVSTFDGFALHQPDSYGALREFGNFLEEVQPDVIHFHHVLNFGLEAIHAARRARPEARIVLTLHDYYAICPNYGQLYKHDRQSRCDGPDIDACLRCMKGKTAADLKMRELDVAAAIAQCDVVTSPSHFLIDMTKRSTTWGNRIRFVENGLLPGVGVEIDEPRSPPRSGGNVELAYFGNISKVKGIVSYLNAAMAVASKGVTNLRFHVFGEQLFADAPVDAVIDEARTVLGGAVTFHGMYRPNQLPSAMAGIDAVVFPSIWWENAPLVIYEALAHKKPVLCFPHGGAQEILERYGAGLFAVNSTTAALTDLFEKVAGDPSLLRAFNVRGKLPSLADAFEEYKALYGDPARRSAKTRRRLATAL